MKILAIEHIVSGDQQHGGKPMIGGTMLTVQEIAHSLHNGLTAEQIADNYELTLGQVYAALSYYYDHRADIDAAIDADKVRTAAHLEDLERRGQAISLEALKQRIESRR